MKQENEHQNELLEQVARFARQEGLFEPVTPGQPLRLCAAVSGGADSKIGRAHV